MSEQHEPPSNAIGGLRRLWSRRTASEATGLTLPGTALRVAATPSGSTGTADPAATTALLHQLFARAHSPEALLAAFAQGMGALHGELGDMGQRLQSAFSAGDWESYARALRQLIDKYIRTIDIADPATGGLTDAERLRELLRHVLGAALAALLQRAPALARDAQALGTELRQWHPGQDLAALDQRIRELCHQVGLRSEDMQEQQNLLLGLFDLLLENVAELLDDRSWLQGQIQVIRGLIAGPLDAASVEQARTDLREVIYKQGLLRQGISESKQAMRQMMTGFVERLDGMATSTGQFHDRVSGYSQAIGQARSITDLGRLLQDVLDDTASVQAHAAGARDELIAAQRQVEAAEQRIQALEQELRDVSGLVREDQLTGALNRRGFEELFLREAARTERGGQPLCVALLDLDDFRHVNETHGHAGGDAALRHVVDVAATVLRTTDAIARFGGEEFVVLLPDATIFEAAAAMGRLQRTLAQRALLHDDMRVFISFSGGVAMRRPQESQDELLKRADRAMYEAKRTGKNRVVSAD